MAKKKKMTPAQAAAARRDGGPKRPRTASPVKDSGPVDRGNRFIVVITVVMVAIIVVISMVYAIAPNFGLFGG